MSHRANVVDSAEIMRALANLDLVGDYLEAAKSALEEKPITAILCGAELAVIITRLRNVYRSCLATSSNYQNVEFGLPGKFESETAGTAPALALAVAGALTYLPNIGQGVTGAIRGGQFNATGATTLSQLVGRLRALQATNPGTLRIESFELGEAQANGMSAGRHFVVYLPGMSSATRGSSPQPFNLTSGIYSLAGIGASDAESATRAAMKLAGIGSRPGDRVTFVGYSEGALVAANLAKSGSYKVSGLVSVGGQIGNVEIPKEVPVLAIENKNDLMAKLDFRENPNNKNWLTVELGGSNVFEAHDIKVYESQAHHIDEGGFSAVQAKLHEILPSQPLADVPTTNNLYRTQIIG